LRGTGGALSGLSFGTAIDRWHSLETTMLEIIFVRI